MQNRREMDLVRPSSERRNECDPSVVAQDGALAARLALDDVAVQAASGLAHVPRLRSELALKDGRHERIGIDLSVRMMEGDSDRLTSILEDIHVSHVGQTA